VVTTTQRRELEATGITRIPGVVESEVARRVADRVWSFFAERGILCDVPATWPPGLCSKNQRLERSGTFSAFLNAKTRTLLTELLGRGHWGEAGHEVIP